MKSKLLALFLAALIAFPNAAVLAATGCNYPTSHDTYADKATGDFLTVADVNSRSCAIEKLESGPLRPTDGSISAPSFSFRDDSNTGMYRSGVDTIDFSTGGVRALQLGTAASGVNYFVLTPSATGGALQIDAAGSDTNISVAYDAKGSGAHIFRNAGGATELARVDATGLGIGTTAPGQKLHISADTSAVIRVDSFGTAVNSQQLFVRGRGTAAAPAAVLAGDVLGYFQGWGQYSATPGQVAQGAAVQFFAAENFTATANGSDIRFYSVLNGSTGAVERARLTNDGAVQLVELTAAPACPASSTGVNMYHKADTIIFQFNDAGTCRYKSLTLSGTGSSWSHATTSP